MILHVDRILVALARCGPDATVGILVLEAGLLLGRRLLGRCLLLRTLAARRRAPLQHERCVVLALAVLRPAVALRLAVLRFEVRIIRVGLRLAVLRLFGAHYVTRRPRRCLWRRPRQQHGCRDSHEEGTDGEHAARDDGEYASLFGLGGAALGCIHHLLESWSRRTLRLSRVIPHWWQKIDAHGAERTWCVRRSGVLGVEF